MPGLEYAALAGLDAALGEGGYLLGQGQGGAGATAQEAVHEQPPCLPEDPGS